MHWNRQEGSHKRQSRYFWDIKEAQRAKQHVCSFDERLLPDPNAASCLILCSVQYRRGKRRLLDFWKGRLCIANIWMAANKAFTSLSNRYTFVSMPFARTNMFRTLLNLCCRIRKQVGVYYIAQSRSETRNVLCLPLGGTVWASESHKWKPQRTLKHDTQLVHCSR